MQQPKIGRVRLSPFTLCCVALAYLLRTTTRRSFLPFRVLAAAASEEDGFVRVKDDEVDSPENEYTLNRVDLFGPLIPDDLHQHGSNI